jgi:hypothetical protein
MKVIRRAGGNSGAAEPDQESVLAPSDELGPPDYKELGDRVSTILRAAEQAAEAILQNAVERAKQTGTDAHERASAELDAAQREVESARQEAAAARAEAEGFRSSRATDAEKEALHIQDIQGMAARDMRQLAEEIAGRRQELDRVSRVFEERLSRLATDIEPAERRSRSPAVATLASALASTSAREPAMERMVELTVAIVLAAAFVIAMIFLLILLA